jgi:hypothetical protein
VKDRAFYLNITIFDGPSPVVRVVLGEYGEEVYVQTALSDQSVDEVL